MVFTFDFSFFTGCDELNILAKNPFDDSLSFLSFFSVSVKGLLNSSIYDCIFLNPEKSILQYVNKLFHIVVSKKNIKCNYINYVRTTTVGYLSLQSYSSFYN